jgi:hypothetical protein
MKLLIMQLAVWLVSYLVTVRQLLLNYSYDFAVQEMREVV